MVRFHNEEMKEQNNYNRKKMETIGEVRGLRETLEVLSETFEDSGLTWWKIISSLLVGNWKEIVQGKTK